MTHGKNYDTNALNAQLKTSRGPINPKNETMTQRKTYDKNAFNALVKLRGDQLIPKLKQCLTGSLMTQMP